jgi:prophage regulatory protein
MSKSLLITDGPDADRLALAIALLVSMPQLELMLGLHRTRIYGLIRQGQFPRPIKLGRTARWMRSEVDQWLAKLAAHQVEQTGGES